VGYGAVVATPLAKLTKLTPGLVPGLVLALVFGCYHGFDVEEKEPPPGHPGGTCLPEGCYGANECYAEEDVCLDPVDPCKGIYCAGFGSCGVDLDTNRPFCSCDSGYTNEPYAYFCIPIGL
jgi:hypothetical protein